MQYTKTLLCLLTLCALPARAADIYWTNTLGGNWNVPANWSPNQVPGMGDSAFITQAGTYTVAVNVDATLGSLLVGATSGTQTVSVASFTLRLNGASVFSSKAVLRLAGGAVDGPGEITVNGFIDWTGGTIEGVGVLNANGGMAISGSGDKFLYARTINNGGTVTWTSSGNLRHGFGAVFNNPAGSLFDMQTDADILRVGTGSTLSFKNAGTFRKSAGPGANEFNAVSFYNAGNVEIQIGAFQLANGEFIQTAGSTLLNESILFAHFGTKIRGGLIGGTGSFLQDVTYGFSMSGQLSPGLSAGRIEANGNYIQNASGSYNCEIGGTIAGTNYDQVSITGSAQLAGTINVVSINGFVPALGDRFEIMKFGSVSGSGSLTFQGLDITNGVYLQPVFSPTNLVLVATNAPLSAAPKLNLARNGDSLWLWWPLGYGAFNVQSTTNLNTPIPWSPVAPAELNRHTFTPAGPAKFFRMISP